MSTDLTCTHLRGCTDTKHADLACEIRSVTRLSSNSVQLEVLPPALLNDDTSVEFVEYELRYRVHDDRKDSAQTKEWAQSTAVPQQQGATTFVLHGFTDDTSYDFVAFMHVTHVVRRQPALLLRRDLSQPSNVAVLVAPGVQFLDRMLRDLELDVDSMRAAFLSAGYRSLRDLSVASDEDIKKLGVSALRDRIAVLAYIRENMPQRGLHPSLPCCEFHSCL